MSTQTVHLHDPSGRILATAAVAGEGGSYSGTVDLRSTPAEVRDLFDEFEEIVNGQMLSLVDDVADRVAALRIKVTFDNGGIADVKNLQIFPGDGTISFAVGQAAARMQASRVGRP